jgi:CSLREA domain-containing protein
MQPTRQRHALALLLTTLMLASTIALALATAPRSAVAASGNVAGQYDTTGDGQVTNADVMGVVNAWINARESGSSCTGASAADLNNDGCVTIADVQAISARLGGKTARGGINTQVSIDGAISPAIASVPAANPMILVNSTGDAPDAAPDDGVCATSGGACTLRAAIETANRLTGPDAIGFLIPGTGPQSINIATELPAISDETGGTIVNGYSQPGASANTDPVVSNAVIRIQIVGPRAIGNQTSINGFIITSPNNVIRGVTLTRLKRSIWISGPDAYNNVIEGTFVGTNAAGEPWYDQINAVENRGGDNGAFGIWISGGAQHNRIGGTTPAERVVVSGNANDGVGMRNDDTSYNVILGSLIGMHPNGLNKIRNWGDGFDFNYGAARNIIGGLSAEERNVITGNQGEGIEISHDSTTAFNQVIGNYIGVGVDGLRPTDPFIRNSGYAISVEDGPADNQIGPGNIMAQNVKGGIHLYGHGNTRNHIFGNRIGVDLNNTPTPNGGDGIHLRYHAFGNIIGPGNVIAYNAGAGVALVDSDADSHTITQNSIFANDGLGIDIDPLGVTPNDTGDLDDGPNDTQNFPVLTQATEESVSGTACAGCTIEIFIADAGSGAYGEGRTFIGTDVASGTGAFTVAVSGVVEGQYVTSTATDTAGNTSEFSANLVVGEDVPPPPPGTPIPGTIQFEDYNTGGQNVGYFDTTTGNNGGKYRSDDVDIQSCTDPTTPAGQLCYNIGWTAPGEWLAYDVYTEQGGFFALTVRVATPSNGRSLTVKLDDAVVLANVAIPNTGGYQVWASLTTDSFEIPSGTHRITVVTNASGANLNEFSVVSADEPPPPPPPGTPIPGIIQAEDYNQGGQNVGYYDTTAGNTGALYRSDDVDIQACSDPSTPGGESCFNVGWTVTNEWLAYDVYTAEGGSFTLTFRVATPSNKKSYTVQLDGVEVLPTVAIANTGGYQKWSDVTTSSIAIPTGTHTLKIIANGTNINFNYFRVNAAQGGN